MKFEKNLELIRKRKGFSQEELSLAIGVSRQTIYTWEGGLNYPNILMLKKIAHVLDVSTDDLLNGYDVSKLPKKFKSVEFNYISDRKDRIKYLEVPNWFIPLKEGEEVCTALYDNGIRDYSYHLTVLNKIHLHDTDGYEIRVEEYDPELNKVDTYSLIIKEENDELFFLGRIYFEDGMKCIETFKDEKFLKQWGIGKQFLGQSMIYDNAENYELIIDGKKQKAIKISYFDPDGTTNPKNSYFEVFLNQNLQSIFWQRYTMGVKSKKSIDIDGQQYGLGYQSLTDRIKMFES